MAETVYLLLGSDLGDRKKFLDRARRGLEAVSGFTITAVSPVYLTEARDMSPGSPSFLNQVIRAEYDGTPEDLLAAAEAIELALGRTGKSEKKPRTIDIDLLLFGERIVRTPVLTIPHARLNSRRFALIPLLDIDPNIADPITGQPLGRFLDDRGDTDVKLYEDNFAGNA